MRRGHLSSPIAGEIAAARAGAVQTMTAFANMQSELAVRACEIENVRGIGVESVATARNSIIVGVVKIGVVDA